MDINSLAHTKWNCKYHIVFAPKYRRKVAYGKMKQDIANILSMLCMRSCHLDAFKYLFFCYFCHIHARLPTKTPKTLFTECDFSCFLVHSIYDRKRF